jgi:hypothetical protein
MPTQITSAGITFNDATSLTSANIGTAQLVNGSVTAVKLGTTEQKQICKAWVNFDGTTSPGTIRSSYNVSSVTKNGTGDYTVNFATPMSDANYSVTSMCRQKSLSNQFTSFSNTTLPSSASFRIVVVDTSVTAQDTDLISLSVFGN